MTTATVTSKGRITNPMVTRKALAIETGDRLEFIPLEGGKVMIVAVTKSITDLKGRFAKLGRPVTIEGMNTAIADQATGRSY